MAKSVSLSLDDWNWAVLMLVQAMIGAISSNFRMIELAFEEGRWLVRVTLETDKEEDREEVEEICDRMSIYLMDVQDRISKAADAAVDFEILISQGLIILSPELEPRVVFRRREPSQHA